MNYDAAETVGWPRFAATVVAVRAHLADTRVAVLARNYGEAGAVDQYLPALRPAFSGHNAYWTRGSPPGRRHHPHRTGYDQAQLRQWFGRVDLAARIDNGVGLHNDEQGPPSGSPATAAPPGRPWTVIWPQLRRYR